MKKKILCAILVLLFISGVTLVARAGINSQSHNIPLFIISGGGTDTNSPNFELSSTLGQPSIPPGTQIFSKNFILSPGFWPMDPNREDLKVEMSLPAGWSMISLPLLPKATLVSDLFPSAVIVYGYSSGKGYFSVNKLEVGKGYWILLNEAQTFTLFGQAIDKYMFSRKENGWSMIGGCTYQAKASSKNCKIQVIYKYIEGAGYQTTKILEPGKGFWISVNNVIIPAEVTVQGIN